MGRIRDAKTGAEVFQFDQSEALLRKVMENAAVGTALIGRDRRLLYVNPAFAQMLGLTTPDCLGGDIGEFVHPECDTGLVLQLQRLLRGEIEDFRTEARLRNQDGSATWVLASASDLRSEQTGKPLYVILQVSNIDRQKRAESALAYSESRWNFALEAAGQGVWDFDGRNNTVFYSNQWRRMRGIPLGEQVDPAQGKWLERVHPDDVDRVLSTVDRQNKGVDGFETLEYRERHRDGHWIWILSRGKPVEWDASGNAIRTIGTDTDITRLKAFEAELAGEKERLRVTLESIGDGVISIDAQRRIVFVNPAAARMTGWSASEAVGRMLEDVFMTVDETTGAPARDLVNTCLETGDIAYLDEDVVLIGHNGVRCDIRSSVAPLTSTGGELIGCVLAFQDVSTSRTLQRQLSHSATHDALTGLPNRVAFERALDAVTAEAQRDMRTHSLCFIDLDRFKSVNDNAGHAAGDELLRRVAEVIRRNCRRQDFAARIGGDEFALLLADCPVQGAQRVAQKLIDAISGMRFHWADKSYEIGASVGITGINDDGRLPVELMSEADAACYVAKAAGRSQVAVYQPSASST